MIKNITGLLLFLIMSVPLLAQTPTVKQLYDEYRKNKPAFETKYRDKVITLTGKIRSITAASSVWKDQDFHRIYLTATGYENFVVCQLPYTDSAILSRYKAGDMIRVTGLTTSISDGIYLAQCEILPAEAVVTKSTAPVNAPLGKYKVYQNDGTGFNYQYRLELRSYNEYQVNGKSGSCVYDVKAKTILFSSGPLKGFAGLYRPTTDNPKDPPGFLLNANGSIPVLNSTHSGYQFAYYEGQ
ncbi:MAG: hypothetical protein JWQ27_51 [Ferruginibacter sp.]|nr:hypothetical protein [Ferruginibacter sp.]